MKNLTQKIQKAYGIDMHKDNIKSRYLGIGNQAVIRDFGTTTQQLKALYARYQP